MTTDSCILFSLFCAALYREGGGLEGDGDELGHDHGHGDEGRGEEGLRGGRDQAFPTLSVTVLKPLSQINPYSLDEAVHRPKMVSTPFKASK